MLLALILAAICFLIGVLACRRIAVFRLLHLPACVVAGFVGLAITSSLSGFGAATEIAGQWSSWPSILIAFVFASMLLMPPQRRNRRGDQKDGLASVGREGLMVWIIVLGQTAIGCATVRWIIQGRETIPDAAGMLIETGFAGGHGTAAAMGEVFRSESIDFAAGSDLGLMMATIGLVYGIISGVAWVNLGIRRGWVNQAVADPTRDPSSDPRDEDSPSSSGVDPWMLQAIWLLLAFAAGWCLQASVGWYAEMIQSLFAYPVDPDDPLARRMNLAAIIGSFPLFIYTLAGGFLVRQMITIAGWADRLDAKVLSRQSSILMDILVVAAIGSLNLPAVAAGWFPLAMLTIAGAVWTAVCLLLLSRLILPRQHWFELGLINYGMSTGVTATGFVLLRIVDPDLRSGAAEDYALAAPISSPFVGGGILTIGLPILVIGTFSLTTVTLVLVALVAAMIGVGIAWNRPQMNQPAEPHG